MGHAASDTRDIRAGLDAHEIGLSVDTRYNTTRFGDRRKNVGQSATQAITTAMNVQTGDIVEYATQSKLCHRGSTLRAQGQEVVCCGSSSKNNHSGCTASLEYGENVSEVEMNMQIAEKCVIDDTLPTTIVSDNDGKGADAYARLLEHLPDLDVTSQSDPSHIVASQLRAVARAEFSNTMFDASTKTERMHLQQVLARDITHRSGVIARILQNRLKDHSVDITHWVNDAVKAAVKCLVADQKCQRI